MAGHSSTLDIVPQRVRRGRLCDAGGLNGTLERTLEGLVIQMVAAHDAAVRVGGMVVLREHPEPGPARAHAGVLALQCVRQFDACDASLHIAGPYEADPGQLFAQVGHERLGQHDNTVFRALAFAHDQGMQAEVDVLDPQLKCLADAQAGAVEQPCQQPMLTIKPPKHLAHLLHGQHHRQPAMLPRVTSLSRSPMTVLA